MPDQHALSGTRSLEARAALGPPPVAMYPEFSMNNSNLAGRIPAKVASETTQIRPTDLIWPAPLSHGVANAVADGVRLLPQSGHRGPCRTNTIPLNKPFLELDLSSFRGYPQWVAAAYRGGTKKCT